MSLKAMRRWTKAVVMNIVLEVKRSAPARTIMTSPTGNISAPAVRIRPGAFSWYHEAVSVERSTAQLVLLQGC